MDRTSKRDLKTLALGAADDNDDCSQTARGMIDRYHLHDQVDAYRDKDPGRNKSILDKWQDWRHRNEAAWFAGNFFFWVTLAAYGLFYTNKGNEVAIQLIDLYSTWPGMIGFWVIVGMLGLFAMGIVGALCERYRFIYHVFWLGMISGFYFIKEDTVVAGMMAAFYFGSLYLPKIWHELSNELTSKIVDGVNDTLAKKST